MLRANHKSSYGCVYWNFCNIIPSFICYIEHIFTLHSMLNSNILSIHNKKKINSRIKCNLSFILICSYADRSISTHLYTCHLHKQLFSMPYRLVSIIYELLISCLLNFFHTSWISTHFVYWYLNTYNVLFYWKAEVTLRQINCQCRFWEKNDIW